MQILQFLFYLFSQFLVLLFYKYNNLTENDIDWTVEGSEIEKISLEDRIDKINLLKSKRKQ